MSVTKIRRIKMKRLYIALLMIIALMIPANPVLAYEAEGWYQIGEDLFDGDGAEFVVPGIYDVIFSGTTEFERVLYAASWVASHMVYEDDPPGDVWKSSDQSFDEIDLNGFTTGDCEDFSILLCALMRFNIGVPANKVWVQAGIIAAPEYPPPDAVPPVFGHAYVVYKAQRGGIWYIEPQFGYVYRGSTPSIAHWASSPPYIMGESAMLRFNDQWVKGGGVYRNIADRQ